ncbi:MAG: peptidylprolyl isomerase [Candidatus Magasanikbacteria bacterium]
MTENNTQEGVQESTKKDSSKGMKTLGYGFVAALAVLAIGSFFFVKNSVKNVSENEMVVKVAGIMNISAASINGKTLPYTQYLNHLHAIRKFAAANPDTYGDLKEAEMSDMVLSRQLINILLTDVAKDFDVSVTEEDKQTAKDNLLAEFGGDKEAANTELMTNYDWDLDTYFDQIVLPVLLEEKLGEAVMYGNSDLMKEYATTDEAVRARHILFMVEEGEDDATVKSLAESVLQKIKNGEATFEDMAKEHGSDGTATLGGDLGWFEKGDMVGEFETACFSVTLENGQPKLLDQLVKTQYGYHIIRVDGKTTVKDFAAYMDEVLRNAKINVHMNVTNPFVAIQEKLEAEKNAPAEETADTTPVVEDIQIEGENTEGLQVEVVK